MVWGAMQKPFLSYIHESAMRVNFIANFALAVEMERRRRSRSSAALLIGAITTHAKWQKFGVSFRPS
jgi:hypothetical protein